MVFYLFKFNKKDNEVFKALDPDIFQSSWIDGLQRQIKVRRKALPEILVYLESSEFDNKYTDIFETIKSLFLRIDDVLNNINLNNEDIIFKDHATKN